MATIGVAVGVPEPYATQIQGIRRQAGDPLADRIRTHVTLLPPTEVTDAGLPAVERHLEAVASRRARFTLELFSVETFRPVSPVEYIRVTRGGRSCAGLAAAVRSGPLARELDLPYHPHVTIAHHVPDPALDEAGAALAEFRLAFEVASFQLYRQGDDLTWHPVRSYELAGPVGDEDRCEADDRVSRAGREAADPETDRDVER